MKSTSKLLLVAGIALVATTGCVSKSEFNTHVTNHENHVKNHEDMRDSIIAWSLRIQAWQGLTYNVICDIVAKNSPNSGMTYAQQTIDYCPAGGTEGDGEPPPPPDIDQF